MRTIKLNTIFPEMITTRESLKLILPFLEKDQPTLLDFENIRFISRSVADEFFTIQMEKNIRFEYGKMNPNVEAMIQVVANTQKGSARDIQKIPYTSFSSVEDLNKFLEAI